MYKIDLLSQEFLDKHYRLYAQDLQRLMRAVRDGLEIPYEFGRSNVEKVVFKVHNTGYTYKFLDKYSTDAGIRQLLCGDYDQLLDIVREVDDNIPNNAWMEGATKAGYEAGCYDVFDVNTDGLNQIDHFNEIIRWIFVEQMYEGKSTIAPFDKKQYILDRDLTVCPYCGKSYIEVEEEQGYQDDKPPIDHYLPKSKYPFFALSCYNMIPCCTSCNSISNKGSNNPISDAVPSNVYLLNPHIFYDNAIRFSYEYNEKGDLNENNFKVNVMAESADLEVGYFGWLKLRSFYQKKKLEVQDIHTALTKYSADCGNFLKKEGVTDDFLNDVALRTVGHSLDGKVSRRLLYKFHKEILECMIQNYGL